MSSRSRLAGGVLCLAGGLLIGYRAGNEGYLKPALGEVNASVNAIPYLPDLIHQLSTTEWYLGAGLVFTVLGLILAVAGGDGRVRAAKSTTPITPPVQTHRPGTCKFCGSDLEGSITYCPSCGRSQS